MKTKNIVKNFTVSEVKEAGNQPRTLVVKISTSNPDRYGDTVQPKGMMSENFMNNPVVLFAHNYSALPVAKALDLKPTDDAVLATVKFPDEGVSQMSDTVYQMYKDGFLSAWSIGFLVPEDGYTQNDFGGYNISKWELLEFSAVPVPANPEALTVMKSKGINVEAFESLIEEEKKELKGLDEEKEEEVIIKKDADNPADPGYTMDTKITDLTVKQLMDVIDRVLDQEQEENDDDGDEPEDGEKGIKSGRTLSSKHEKMLKDSISHMQQSMDNVTKVLSSVADSTDDDDEDGEGKSADSLVHRLAKELTKEDRNALEKSLKKADKNVGITLRLLKAINNNSNSKTEGGEI